MQGRCQGGRGGGGERATGAGQRAPDADRFPDGADGLFPVAEFPQEQAEVIAGRGEGSRERGWLARFAGG